MKSKITQKEFEHIYQNELTPKQKKALHLFLEGKSDPDIAWAMEVTDRSTVSKHLTKISTLFGFPPAEEPDYRCTLIELFAKYKPELVSAKALEKCGYSTSNLRFPEGTEPLDSPFYIQRSDLEKYCCNELKKVGTLIRIKAPRRMGKTSLLKRIIDHSQKLNYHTIYLNFSLIEKHKLEQSTQFLKTFYDYINARLSQLAAWTQEDYTMLNCTSQMQILLKQLDRVLILVLDEVDCLFKYPELYQNFFPMLRNWKEQANESDAWEKLRIVIAHSTQDYGKLKITQSPFNIGIPIDLKDLNEEQVSNLAMRHGLENKVVAPIMSLVGGNPFLVRLAFYYLVRHEISLEELLRTATTDSGIYEQYLQEYLELFWNNQELAHFYKEIVTAKEPIQVTGKARYQLESIGLIKYQDNKLVPSCLLYKHYFQEHL